MGTVMGWLASFLTKEGGEAYGYISGINTFVFSR